jgi:hypothetical protein
VVATHDDLGADLVGGCRVLAGDSPDRQYPGTLTGVLDGDAIANSELVVTADITRVEAGADRRVRSALNAHLVPRHEHDVVGAAERTATTPKHGHARTHENCG